MRNSFVLLKYSRMPHGSGCCAAVTMCVAVMRSRARILDGRVGLLLLGGPCDDTG
jgi:hypothetical protein